MVKLFDNSMSIPVVTSFVLNRLINNSQDMLLLPLNLQITEEFIISYHKVTRILYDCKVSIFSISRKANPNIIKNK